MTLRGNRAVSKASRRWRMSGPRLYGRLERLPTSRHRRDARRLKDGRSAQTSQPSTSGKVILKTGGTPLVVSTEALQPVVADHDFFLGMQTDNPSLSQMTLVTWGTC